VRRSGGWARPTQAVLLAGGPAFDLASIRNTVGCPVLRAFCEGREPECPRQGLVTRLKTKSRSNLHSLVLGAGPCFSSCDHQISAAPCFVVFEAWAFVPPTSGIGVQRHSTVGEPTGNTAPVLDPTHGPAVLAFSPAVCAIHPKLEYLIAIARERVEIIENKAYQILIVGFSPVLSRVVHRSTGFQRSLAASEYVNA
jgi:hypothetical protein